MNSLLPKRSVLGPRLCIALLIAGLGVCELGLRAAGFGDFVHTYSSERYGWRMWPDIEYLDPPYGTPVRTNSLGFRDSEWRPSEPDTASVQPVRVAVLGNSVAWGGGGLPLERRFDRVLVENLADDPELGAQAPAAVTMNFSLPGYTFEQMARIYEDEVRPYRPDVVVVTLLPYDIRPMRVMGDSASYPFRKWVDRSALRDFFMRRVFGGWGQTAMPVQLDVERAVLSDPLAPEHEPLWNALLERLGGLDEAVRSEGGQLVLVALPVLQDIVDPEQVRGIERLVDWASSHGVVCCDPRAEFISAMAPLTQEIENLGLRPDRPWASPTEPAVLESITHIGEACFYFEDSLHLTEFGHLILGRALHETLRSADLL